MFAALAPEELTQAINDNLRNLGLDVLVGVNLRSWFDLHHVAEGSMEAPLTVLAELLRRGVVQHIGPSKFTPAQIADACRICEIVAVQNYCNLLHRADDTLTDDWGRGVPHVPFLPLAGFTLTRAQ